jgi:hypothetical protein
MAAGLSGDEKYHAIPQIAMLYNSSKEAHGARKILNLMQYRTDIAP